MPDDLSYRGNGVGSNAVAPSLLHPYRPETLAIHAGDHLPGPSDVAPPIHVSTIFRYNDDPEQLVRWAERSDTHAEIEHIYSRDSSSTQRRLETTLAALLLAPAVTYSSGLAAIHAAYVLLNPKQVSIGAGYHGSHGVLSLHTRLSGLKLLPMDCPAEDLHPGDIIHLETPLNPTGEASDIRAFADKAHARGAYLFVDATFGPPGLQDPFALGADMVMHAGTKYLGGHSDMLCGVLATRNRDWIKGLLADRLLLGSIIGSLEGWLGIRSLRTLELRVRRQSETAGQLVAWLSSAIAEGPSRDEAVATVVERIQHASLQHKDMHWLKEQMPNGFGPVFALWMKSEKLARCLPSKLRLFDHCTSLGGVESTIEWRVMTDTTVDGRLMRVSIGVENWEDLKGDLLLAFKALGQETQ